MSVLQEMQKLSGTILLDGAYVKSTATESLEVIDPAGDLNDVHRDRARSRRRK